MFSRVKVRALCRTVEFLRNEEQFGTSSQGWTCTMIKNVRTEIALGAPVHSKGRCSVELRSGFYAGHMASFTPKNNCALQSQGRSRIYQKCLGLIMVDEENLILLGFLVHSKVVL